MRTDWIYHVVGTLILWTLPSFVLAAGDSAPTITVFSNQATKLTIGGSL
jgi:hypothetical protein